MSALCLNSVTKTTEKSQEQGCRSQIKKTPRFQLLQLLLSLTKQHENITPIYEIESSIIYEYIFLNFS